MASEERSAADPLGNPEELIASAYRHGFFSVVSLLERLTPGAPRIGGLGPVSEEGIRLRHDPSLTFSSSDVSKVSLKKRNHAPGNELSPTRQFYEVVTTFLGLTGAATPLPMYIAEEVAKEDPDHPAQRDFLDIFHHRVLSLLFRLRAKYSFHTEYLSDQSDAWSRRALALAGVDTFEGPPNTSLPLWRLMRLAPLLAERSRSARKLELALEDVLGEELDGAKLRIQQFVPRWVSVEARQRMKLGIQNTHLGRDFVLGIKVMDRGGKFRIVIGPLSQKNFKWLSPGGEGLRVVKDIVALFSRDELDYDLELILGKDAATSFRLGTAEPSRLGKDTWLGRRGEETRVIVDRPSDLPDEVPAGDGSGARPAEDSAPHGFGDEDFEAASHPPSPREGRHAR